MHALLCAISYVTVKELTHDDYWKTVTGITGYCLTCLFIEHTDKHGDEHHVRVELIQAAVKYGHGIIGRHARTYAGTGHGHGSTHEQICRLPLVRYLTKGLHDVVMIQTVNIV